MDLYVKIYLNLIIVDAMDKILDLIYRMFISKTKDLEMGHTLKDKDLCDIWETIYAYEMLDSNMLSLKERKLIIEQYD